jgi:hypothetical protein
MNHLLQRFGRYGCGWKGFRGGCSGQRALVALASIVAVTPIVAFAFAVVTIRGGGTIGPANVSIASLVVLIDGVASARGGFGGGFCCISVVLGRGG